MVSADGIECDPKKIEAMKNWPIPETVTDVRSFLGFTNHYRHFIEGYAKIAKSLNQLISRENASHKKKNVEWTRECQLAFDRLKEKCTQTPILAYAKYKRPFIVYTDASESGLGAILYQKDEAGLKRVIAYASRTLNPSERKYPTHKLEFLALKWAITDRFHEYLYRGTFDVYTDNTPLTYILTSAKLDATGQRWVASLANYDFQLFYKTGKSNVEADALSRIKHNNYQQVPVEVVKAVTTSVSLNGLTNFIPLSNPVISKTASVPEPKQMTNQQWQQEQQNDNVIHQVLEALAHKKKSSQYGNEQVKTILRHRESLIVRNKLLYWKYVDSATAIGILQFVLPQHFRHQALQACHGNVGHLGIERTTHLLKDRFYWPNMQKDIEKYIQQCSRCLHFKTLLEKAEMHPFEATRPWELIHIDSLTIEAPQNSKSGKDVNILVITDHFTRFAQAIVTTSQKASVVAKVLWDQFFMNYGIPEKILSDQGRNFESKLIEELCLLSQVNKLRTTPYRPQTNGSCERFNRTLISIVGTLLDEHKSCWVQHVPTLVHAYNCTRNNATGYSPYYLLYGHKPLLPIDIEFGVKFPEVSDSITMNYVKKLKNRLEWTYRKAADNSRKENQRAKFNFNKSVQCSKLEVGDIVMVRAVGFRGKHKITDRWEDNLYKVLSQREDGLPVFQVQNLSMGQEKTLHRNLLYPVQHDLDSENTMPKDCHLPGADTLDEVYQGPVTCSRTKLLMKANMVMNEHFNIAPSDVPSFTSPVWLELCYQFWY